MIVRLWVLLSAVLLGCGADPGLVGGPSPGAPAAAVPTTVDPTIADPTAALVAAAEAGSLSEVRNLLAGGAPLEGTDKRGRTALVAAAYGAHLEVAELLVEAGANVNHEDDSQQSAYLIATSEIGPDEGLALLRLTLAHGADVGALDSYNGTGLIRAAHRGYGGIVAELVDAGIEVDHVNGLRWTALEAIILGQGGPAHTEVVQLLVDAGADHTITDSDGVTPLAHARARSYTDIVAVLEAAGVTA